MISKELIEIMCCPACKGDIEEKDSKIVCLKCGRRYPIKDDIPIMLVDEAQMPDEGEKEQNNNA